jgi:hypothetical protein
VPESITPVSIIMEMQGLWIPGSRLSARPGMTAERFSTARKALAGYLAGTARIYSTFSVLRFLAFFLAAEKSVDCIFCTPAELAGAGAAGINRSAAAAITSIVVRTRILPVVRGRIERISR